MAVEFDSLEMSKAIIDKCIEQGVLSDWFLFASDCLRISQPLVIEDNEITNACNIILKVCNK